MLIPEITLHIAPGSCSRVPLTALLETGVAFETKVVRFMAGEHKSVPYKAINPKGKVPALVIDGEALSENVAILSFVHRRFPAAGLLPAVTDPLAAARQVADLCFCAATLHPIVTRIRLPGMFAAPEAARGVWERACTAMREYFDLIEARLASGDWWYGATWSVMDAYLNWVFWRVAGADFDPADYPRFVAHAGRQGERGAHKRALEIEADATAALEAEGLGFTPPPLPA